MIIHMAHPQHGEMDVYSDAEVAANAKNGWVVSEIKTDRSVITIMPESDNPPVFRRAPGRPKKYESVL